MNAATKLFLACVCLVTVALGATAVINGQKSPSLPAEGDDRAALRAAIERGDEILDRVAARCGKDARGVMSSGIGWRTELMTINDDPFADRRVLLLTLRSQAGQLIELRRRCGEVRHHGLQ